MARLSALTGTSCKSYEQCYWNFNWTPGIGLPKSRDCSVASTPCIRKWLLDEHPPSLYTNIDGNNLNYSPNRQVVFEFDENMLESPSGSRRVESNTNDVVMEDVAETNATDDMEVDEEGEPAALYQLR
ncbi:unnamed protein product [Phytophthora lilii]|uniref:Unnamed protein product n=1 Tax=Phytophthora lilii TaxID=2077276 RepID=A0A9W6UEZ6_9STRA|nr:unnamed protein product [Phytophthora lilii]